jgi:glycosyltransferase involved in cell wall biosynthesis
MKIAILGTRGIPARYGGFETFADQLSSRLAAHGHEVTVYCRRPFTTPHDVIAPGVRRVILPTISRKHFDTPFHTLLSLIHVSFTSADVVLICNVANGPIAWIPRLFGKPTVLNVDGLDRKRKKWNLLGRWVLHFCEVLSAFTPSRIVTDAKLMQEYYWKNYRRPSTMIAYGAELPLNGSTPKAFDLPPGAFILYVSRLEPENNPELVLEAYRQVQTEWPLVMVGGNSYDPSYVERLRNLADPRVLFLGPVYGSGYWELLREAGLYLFACEVGGVHPALIEAMAAQKPVLYLDTPENRETAGDAAVPFQTEASDLASKMLQLLGDPQSRRELARKAQERAARLFGWEETTQKYEALFSELLPSKAPTPSGK